MTVTSSTTAVAFFANALSPIMPIRAFGIFTGVLIPINFFLVVMIMPPAVIFFENKIQNTFTRCGGCCPGPDKSKHKSDDVMDITREDGPEVSQLNKVE